MAPRGDVTTLPPHVASSHTATVLPPGGAAGWSRALCTAALALRTRHHLRVLSGERGKEGAAGGDVTGVPCELAWAGLGTWRPPSVELTLAQLLRPPRCLWLLPAVDLPPGQPRSASFNHHQSPQEQKEWYLKRLGSP